MIFSNFVSSTRNKKCYPFKNLMKELAEREIRRLEDVFKEIFVVIPEKSLLYDVAKDLFDFAKGYFEDAKYFYEKGKFLESFELCSYVWGILDAMARIGFINPKKTRKYFKVEQ